MIITVFIVIIVIMVIHQYHGYHRYHSLHRYHDYHRYHGYNGAYLEHVLSEDLLIISSHPFMDGPLVSQFLYSSLWHHHYSPAELGEIDETVPGHFKSMII